MIWQGNVIDCNEPRGAWFALPEQQRAEFIAWQDRQAGCHIDGAYRTEYDLIDAPLIRVTRIVRDENGAAVVTSYPDIVRETSEHLVREPLPGWWHVDRAD